MVEKSVSRFLNSSFKTKLFLSQHEGRRIRESRLGRSLIPGRILSGGVAAAGAQLAHQQEGVGGSLQVPPEHDAARGLCQPVSGLKDICRFRQQAGGNKIICSVQNCLEPLGVSSGQRWLGQGKLATKGAKRGSGHALQVSDRHLGGVTVDCGHEEAVQQVVLSNHGHVREQTVSRDSQVLQLVPRQPGSSEGCFQHDGVAQHLLLFPSCANDQSDVGQDPAGQGAGHHSGANVASQCVVAEGTGDDAGRSSGTGFLQADSVLSYRDEVTLPGSSCGMPGVRPVTLMSEEAQLLMNADIRKSTKKLYSLRFAHFARYCADLGVAPKSCPEEIIINFLTLLRRTFAYEFQTISGYRSAISKYHIGFAGTSVGSSRNIKRLVRAVFLEAPPIPRYADIWSAAQLIDYLRTLHPPATLSDYQLGMKTLSLISLQSISRSSTVAQLAPDFQQVGEQIVFRLMGLEKQSRPGHIRGEVQLDDGPQDQPSLSVALYCQAYAERTAEKRSFFSSKMGSRPDRFFISNNKVRSLKL